MQDFHHPEGTHYQHILARIKAIAAVKSGPDADKRVAKVVESLGGGWVKKENSESR